MELTQTKKSLLVEQVSLQLEKLIESGGWEVGTKIPSEPELAKLLSVSRNTVREAVRALVHGGLLIVRQGDGTYVVSRSGLGPVLQKRLTSAGTAEIFEVRQALEREAAKLAAMRRTPGDLEALTKCHKQCIQAVDELDGEMFVQADLTFHKTVVLAAHNRVLSDLYEHMTEALHASIHDALCVKKIARSHKTIHSDLLDAISRQDPASAALAVDLYIQAALDDLFPGDKLKEE